MFPASFAAILGLDLLKMKNQNTGGVGNSGNMTFYDTIRITINEDIDFHVYAGFTLGLETMGIGLLGQAGFFSQYNVSFDHSRGEFFIETR